MKLFLSTHQQGHFASEHIEAWERVGKVLKPFEDGLHTTLMQNVFIVSRELNNDFESL